MRLYITGSSLAAVLLWGVVGTAAEEPNDQKALQGVWRVVQQDRTADQTPVVCERLVFKGDQLTIHYLRGDRQFQSECSFKLDPTAAPKQIDFTPAAGANKGRAYLGIYELKDGKLRFGYRGPKSSRPKSFEDLSEGNKGTVIYVLERASQ
jgi:uncharacterized protein (TIGR03067 family)